jgi:hypothetical protein
MIGEEMIASWYIYQHIANKNATTRADQKDRKQSNNGLKHWKTEHQAIIIKKPCGQHEPA